MAKISVSKIDKMIKHYASNNMCELSVPVDGEEIVIGIKKYLSPSEEFSCASNIADAVFVNGEYAPEVYRSAVMMNFVLYYTNLKIDAGIDRIYCLAYGGDLIQRMIDCVSSDQLDFICDSAKKRIEHRLRIEEGAQNMKINELLHDLDMATSSLTTITQSFANIDANVMSEAVNKIASIDEQKIIDIMAAHQKERKE